MIELLQDMKYAARRLSRTPGFTLLALATLALGIGANAALFSVVDAVLLRPLPFSRPEGLVAIWSRHTSTDRYPFSLPEFCDYRDRNKSLQAVAGLAGWTGSLVGEETTERLSGMRVSGNLFEMLGVSAALGRALRPSDDDPGSEKVVVLSHGLWQRRFGSDPGIAGRPLILNGEAYVVVGVLPREFLFPVPDIDLAIPLSPEQDPLRHNRGSTNFLRILARVREGSTPAAVTQDPRRDRKAASEGVPRYLRAQEGSSRHALSRGADAELQPHARDSDGRGGAPAARGLREPRESHAGARHGSAEGDGDPAGSRERCPPVGVIGGRESPPVSRDDRPADREAQAQSIVLRGLEGLEDLVELAARDTRAAIFDRELNHDVLSRGRGHRQPPLVTGDRAHGLAAVDDQVQQHLLELHAVAGDGGKAWVQPGHQAHAAPPQIAGGESEHLLRHLVEVEELEVDLAASQERRPSMTSTARRSAWTIPSVSVSPQRLAPLGSLR